MLPQALDLACRHGLRGLTGESCELGIAERGGDAKLDAFSFLGPGARGALDGGDDDGAAPARRLDAATESLDPSILMTYALSSGIFALGIQLLPMWWEEGTRHIRAELPESMHAWIPLLALVPIALLRWLWLVELRRYYRRSDLA
ncbi:MAG: hypothetical protein FJZ38_25675 [Candidatus Rokubacteria bacterium]|nr:hypothetical protein [Candidatus Rokubacteria bacterium]